MLNIQRITQHLTRNVFKTFYSSSTVTQIAAEKLTDKSTTIKSEEQINKISSQNIKNPIVAAAFASLTDDSKNTALNLDVENKNSNSNKTLIDMDERIINARTVNSLLTIGETNGNISRKHALKMVSILAEWSSINKAKISEFENDARFLKLCRILGRTVPKGSVGNSNHNKINGFRTDDLNTVLGVTGDDEAAKMIASISVPQMVKVMSTLALKKRRSTPLLRSLSYNISRNASELNLKHCADLLYAMAVLNFPDPVLTTRICSEIHSGLQQNENKPAVVGSILTSLGLLKYRELDALEALTNWILTHVELCRSQDISSLFMTLAFLNYKPTRYGELESNLVGILTDTDFKKSSDWLSHVWAMVALGLVKPIQIESVLKINFLEKLEKECGKNLTPTLKMKLLNINAAAKLLTSNYKGPLLSKDTDVNVLPIKHNKSKQILVSSILDAIKTLVSSPNLIQTHKDTNMGFVIDAVCIFDSKFNPLPLNKEHPNATKIAIMGLDFHDICQGCSTMPNGITSLTLQLLERSGYKILTVPYNEFNVNEKLLKKVQYLETKLKQIVNNK